jgi:hypothetical protein
MNTSVIIVTCAEPDALPFLLSRPSNELAGATLIATGDVVRSAVEQTGVNKARVIDGMTVIQQVRALAGDADCRVSVVVAPDPWGPYRGKGFVRARLLAPLCVSAAGRADLIELRGDGRSLRVKPGLDRRALLVCLLAFEWHNLQGYLVGTAEERRTGAAPALRRAQGQLAKAILVVPVTAVTLCRLVPFIIRTESRARRPATRLRSLWDSLLVRSTNPIVSKGSEVERP